MMNSGARTETSRRGMTSLDVGSNQSDIQNLLCETSKYTRASNPEVQGSAGRKRIKQRFKAAGNIPKPVFPEHWGINAAADAWWRTNRRTETTRVRETAEQRGLPIG